MASESNTVKHMNGKTSEMAVTDNVSESESKR